MNRPFTREGRADQYRRWREVTTPALQAALTAAERPTSTP
jgi:hypothetical protein